MKICLLCKSNVNKLLIFPTFSNFRIYQFFHVNQTRFLITYFSYVVTLFVIKLYVSFFYYFFYICRKSLHFFILIATQCWKWADSSTNTTCWCLKKTQHHLDHRMLWKEYHYIPFNRTRDHLVRWTRQKSNVVYEDISPVNKENTIPQDLVEYLYTPVF